jgi:glycosyltransferase involved in cell wall biosynthesis
MKRINVLHLRKSAGFFGAEKVILSLSRGLTSLGHGSWIGCIYDSRAPEDSLATKTKEMGLSAITFDCRFVFDLLTILQIYRFVKNQKIDIIHTHGFKADIYGWIVSKLAGKIIVATKHGWTHSNRRIRFWEGMDVLLLPSFDKIIVVSEQLKNDLGGKGISENKISVIQNGIEIDESYNGHLDILKRNIGIPQNDLIVGIIGRLSIEKNHRFFINVAHHLSSVISSVKFLIVGNGPLREELEAYVKSLKLSNVIFTGYRSDVKQVMSMMDVVASTSLREGVPIALLEAMSVKKPIVATQVGGVQKIILHSKTGYLVPLDRLDEFTRCVKKLLDNKNLRKTFGENAFRFLKKHYSSENMVNQYLSVYQNCMT